MIERSHDLCKRHKLTFKPTSYSFDFVIDKLNMVVKIDPVGIFSTLKEEKPGEDGFEWVKRYIDHLDRMLSDGTEIKDAIGYCGDDEERFLVEEYQLMTWDVKNSRLSYTKPSKKTLL